MFFFLFSSYDRIYSLFYLSLFCYFLRETRDFLVLAHSWVKKTNQKKSCYKIHLKNQLKKSYTNNNFLLVYSLQMCAKCAHTHAHTHILLFIIYILRFKKQILFAKLFLQKNIYNNKNTYLKVIKIIKLFLIVIKEK